MNLVKMPPFASLLVACFISLLLFSVTSDAAGSRSFYQGFTPFSYGISDESEEHTYQLLGQHADLIVHHLDDGIPWVEAAEGKPYSEHLEERLQRRLQLTPKGSKMLLSITPLNNKRDDVALYYGKKDKMSLPDDWKKVRFSDQKLIDAYIKHCVYMIKRFNPDYFIYGIEVNLLARYDEQKYEDFKVFAKKVYTALKRKYPKLPISLSFMLENPDRIENAKRTIQPLLPYSDYFAISTYPYFQHEGPSMVYDEIPRNWFTQVKEIAPGKPFAIAETGFLAEDLSIFFFTLKGTEAGQANYVNWMLKEANALDAEFVCWFVLVDYDDLWSLFRWFAFFNPAMKLWKDTGLYDGDVKPRDGLEVWDKWLARRRR